MVRLETKAASIKAVGYARAPEIVFVATPPWNSRKRPASGPAPLPRSHKKVVRGVGPPPPLPPPLPPGRSSSSSSAGAGGVVVSGGGMAPKPKRVTPGSKLRSLARPGIPPPLPAAALRPSSSDVVVLDSTTRRTPAAAAAAAVPPPTPGAGWLHQGSQFKREWNQLRPEQIPAASDSATGSTSDGDLQQIGLDLEPGDVVAFGSQRKRKVVVVRHLYFDGDGEALFFFTPLAPKHKGRLDTEDQKEVFYQTLLNCSEREREKERGWGGGVHFFS